MRFLPDPMSRLSAAIQARHSGHGLRPVGFGVTGGDPAPGTTKAVERLTGPTDPVRENRERAARGENDR